MTEFEYQILEECAELAPISTWGAAVAAALESLQGRGFILKGGKVTSVGWRALVARRTEENERLKEKLKPKTPMSNRDWRLKAEAAERQLAEAREVVNDCIRADAADFNTPHPDEAKRRARAFLQKHTPESTNG